MAGAAAGGAIAGLLIANNIGRLQRGIAAATEAWKALESRGMTLATEQVSGLKIAAGRARPTLVGDVGGVRCEVRIVSDLVHYAHTQIRAARTAPGDSVIGVHPSPGGVLGSIREWLAQDVEVGDPAFDEAFLVTEKPAGAAAAMLGPTLRERLTALAGSSFAGFTCTAEEVVVLLHGVEVDADVLGVALDAVAEAAARPS